VAELRERVLLFALFVTALVLLPALFA